MKIEEYEYPDELYYDKHHFWIKDEGDVLILGITDFAQNIAGEFIVVEVPNEGKKLKKGKPFASIESGKWVGRIYAPVNGIITKVNEAVEDDATLLNSSPYDEGWICKIKPDNKDEIKEFSQVSDETFINWVKEEIAIHTQED